MYGQGEVVEKEEVEEYEEMETARGAGGEKEDCRGKVDYNSKGKFVSRIGRV